MAYCLDIFAHFLFKSQLINTITSRFNGQTPANDNDEDPICEVEVNIIDEIYGNKDRQAQPNKTVEIHNTGSILMIPQDSKEKMTQAHFQEAKDHKQTDNNDVPYEIIRNIFQDISF